MPNNLMQKDLLDGLDVWNVSPLPASHLCPFGGIRTEWCAPKLGWGAIDLWFGEDGCLHADTECMCKKGNYLFLSEVLRLLADKVVIDG